MKYKMSDVFDLPLNGIVAGINFKKIKSDFDDGVTPFDAVDYAVNNHDRLTEQVAELKALLELAGRMGFNVATSESSVTHRDYCKRVNEVLGSIGEMK
jgi:hypothetical protein